MHILLLVVIAYIVLTVSIWYIHGRKYLQHRQLTHVAYVLNNVIAQRIMILLLLFLLQLDRGSKKVKRYLSFVCDDIVPDSNATERIFC